MSLVEKAIKKIQSSGVALAREAPAQRQAQADPPRHADATPIAAPRYRQDIKVVINRQALRAAGLLPPEYQERELADQYRQIKRPLIANAMGRSSAQNLKHARLVMVASALPGEGKTFTSINLALSMAQEKDITVLLVDADVAKAHLSRLFGVESEPGLLDALRDDSLSVDELAIPTDVPGFCILPAGRKDEHATELLSSSRMEDIVAELESRDPSRIVLIDSPPLLLTSESRALASVAGQVALVVRAGSTPQQAVINAIGYLSEDQYVGVVLNQSDLSPSTGGYYGHSAYGTYAGRQADPVT